MAKKKNYEELANEIVKKVGGKENVVQCFHCISRLRFELKDRDLIDLEDIKKLDVLGAQFFGTQLQIIIGDEINDVYDAVCDAGEFEKTKAIDENVDEMVKKKRFTLKGAITSLLQDIPGCVMPLLPVLLTVGLITGIYSILGPNMLNIIAEDSDLYKLLYFVAQAGMYFIPFGIAHTGSKRFGCTYSYAFLLAAVMLYPDFIEAAGEGFSVYGIPMVNTQYSSQVLPMIMVTMTLAKVEKYANKYMTGKMGDLFKPLIIVLIMLPITLCVFAPLGVIVGYLVSIVLNFITNVAGPVGAFIIGALWLPLVFTGMHIPLVLPSLLLLSSGQPDFTLLPVISGIVFIGSAADIAVMLKSKDPNVRELAGKGLISIFLGGIIEPQLYSIYLKYKKVFLAHCIGAGAYGVVINLLHVGKFQMAPNNFLTVLGALGTKENLINLLIAAVVGFVVTFVMVMVLGVEDKKKVKSN